MLVALMSSPSASTGPPTDIAAKIMRYLAITHHFGYGRSTDRVLARGRTVPELAGDGRAQCLQVLG